MKIFELSEAMRQRADSQLADYLNNVWVADTRSIKMKLPD